MEFKHKQKIDHFLSLLNSNVLELIDELIENGVGVALVGGAVRDFVLSNKIPTDLDFEIFPLDDCDEKTWVEKIKSTFDKRFEKNDFNVHKIDVHGYDLEFAPARVEFYDSDQEVFSHSSFSVNYLTTFVPEKSFIRRDFTCNAMAILFNKKECFFYDPFSGLDSLKEMSLYACGENFCFDPVRFLRAIRFSLFLEMSLSSELEQTLGKMNLERLSEYYFFKEAFKSRDFFSFVKQFNHIVKIYNIKTPEYYPYIEKLNFQYSEKPQNQFELLILLILKNVSQVELIDLNGLFQYKKGFIAKWMNLFRLCESISIDGMQIKQPLEKFIESSLREQYYDLYKLINNLKLEDYDFIFLKTLNKDLFSKIEFLIKLHKTKKSQKLDYNGIRAEERKYLQAFEFFKA